MKAIILAAGYATRLYPLTIDRPKALLPLGERPMLDYLMRQIAQVPDITEVHIVSNHRFASQFEAWLKLAEEQARYLGLKIVIWDDQTTSDENKLGAIGDIQFVIERAALDDDLLVAASDNFFTFPLTDFVDDFRRSGRDTLLMARLGDVSVLRGFAVATLGEGNRVLGLVEKPENPPSDIGVYALYLYRRDTLPLIKRYLDEGHSSDAPGRLPEWLHTFRDIRGYLFQGECIDIGTPDMYRALCERFEKGGDLFS